MLFFFVLFDCLLVGWLVVGSLVGWFVGWLVVFGFRPFFKFSGNSGRKSR